MSNYIFFYLKLLLLEDFEKTFYVKVDRGPMCAFIVLEGIDGSGKSTVLEYLEDRLEGVHVTSEPTESPAGTLVSEAEKQDKSPYYDLFLFLADRVEHIEEIRELQSKGKTVICDRYWGSTCAYQAASSEIPLKYTEEIQEPFILKPDLTVLFDIDPGTALDRIQHRGDESKYERSDYLTRVRENYLELADRHGWQVIDAGRELEDVKEKVLSLVKNEL